MRSSNFFKDNAPELSYKRDQTTPSLLEGRTLNISQPNLGLNLQLPDNTSALLTHFHDENNRTQILKSDSLKTSQPSISTLTDTVKSLLENERISNLTSSSKERKWLSALNAAEMVYDAAERGKKLSDNIDAAIDSGQSTTEAHVCQIVNTLSTASSEALIKGAITGGIPDYLVASVALPPLAATIPIVAPLIPKAYAGAETTATLFGAAVEDACHDSFAIARRLAAELKK